MKLGKEGVNSYVTLKNAKRVIFTSWTTFLIANAHYGSVHLRRKSKG